MSEFVTIHKCNICKEEFKTKGEAYAHHYRVHKKLVV